MARSRPRCVWQVLLTPQGFAASEDACTMTTASGVRLPQEGTFERLAEWFADGDIAAVHLDIRVDHAPAISGPYTGGHFNLDVQNPGTHGPRNRLS